MSLDFEDIRKVVKDLEVEKNHALCENQKLKDDLNRVREDICRMQNANDKLIEELECFDRTAKKLKDDNDRLRGCIGQKEQEICCLQKLSDKIERLENIICQLERDLDCINKGNCELEEQIAELERCIKEKDCCIRRLECKAAELENGICEMENTIKYLSDENECLKQELEDCRCNVEKANQDLECLCSKQKVCECAKQKLQDQVECLKTSLDHACDALHKEKDCSCKLQAQIKCSQEENHKLKMENSFLHEEKCELNEKINACNKQLKKCQCEYDRAHNECEEFKKCIEQFKTQIISGIKCNTQPDCCMNSNSSKYVSRARSVNFNRMKSKRSSRGRDSCEPDCASSMTSFPQCDGMAKFSANNGSCVPVSSARSRKSNQTNCNLKKCCKPNRM